MISSDLSIHPDQLCECRPPRELKIRPALRPFRRASAETTRGSTFR